MIQSRMVQLRMVQSRASFYFQIAFEKSNRLLGFVRIGVIVIAGGILQFLLRASLRQALLPESIFCYTQKVAPCVVPAKVPRLAHSGSTFQPRGKTQGRVAQLAEHSALNRQVEGSIPSAPTIFPLSASAQHGVDSTLGDTYV
jgi:hypothetical protein